MRFAFLSHGLMPKLKPDAPTLRYYHEALYILHLQCDFPFNNIKQINSYMNGLKMEPDKAWFYWKKNLPDLASASSGIWVAIENDHVVSVINQIFFYLDRIATHPSHLKKGYASALLNHVTDYYQYVATDVPISAPVNLEIIPLFQRHGWAIMETAPKKISSCVRNKCPESKAMYPLFTEHLYSDNNSSQWGKVPRYEQALLFHSRASINSLKA